LGLQKFLEKKLFFTFLFSKKSFQKNIFFIFVFKILKSMVLL